MKQSLYIVVFLLLASFVSELALNVTFAFKYECIDATKGVDDNESSGNQESESEEETNVSKKVEAYFTFMSAYTFKTKSYCKDTMQQFTYTSRSFSSRYTSIPELPPEII